MAHTENYMSNLIVKTYLTKNVAKGILFDTYLVHVALKCLNFIKIRKFLAPLAEKIPGNLHAEQSVRSEANFITISLLIKCAHIKLKFCFILHIKKRPRISL